MDARIEETVIALLMMMLLVLRIVMTESIVIVMIAVMIAEDFLGSNLLGTGRQGMTHHSYRLLRGISQ